HVNCNKDIKTLTLFIIDELIEDKLCSANLRDDEDVIPPFFKDAMDSIGKLRTYFSRQKNGEKTFNELNSMLFQAEILALQKAIDYTTNLPQQLITILVDNQASVLVAANPKGRNPIARTICRNLIRFRPIQVSWIKAHVVMLEMRKLRDWRKKP
ncbi:hypothetical protein AVEN_161852-1, partial [Araneus ventricosus]